MAWLQSADAKADAAEALEENDTNYMATYGFSMLIPGVSAVEAEEIITEENYTVIEGTGDDLCSEEHWRLNNRAIDYAAIYNQTIRAGM